MNAPAMKPESITGPPVPVGRWAAVGSESRAEPSPWQAATLVLWLGCLAVGGLGLALRYPQPKAPTKVSAPTVAELLRVELTPDPVARVEVAPTPAAKPPPLLEPIRQLPAPTLTAVAMPSPAVAFALPIEGPNRTVGADEAAHRQPDVPATSATALQPPVQALTFGEGEGKQPKPQYPSRARLAGQEGTVVVRFSVAEDGSVVEAQLASPSPWPLLNGAALKVVRERWRFEPGRVRLFEVGIRFELGK